MLKQLSEQYELCVYGLGEVRRVPFTRARAAAAPYDFLGTYVDDLPNVLDIDAIRAAGVRIGADPLGGASVAYWGEIAERLGLDLTVVNPLVDPRWGFMTLDWDEKIRMDCSSPSAMASLIRLLEGGAEYDVATTAKVKKIQGEKVPGGAEDIESAEAAPVTPSGHRVLKLSDIAGRESGGLMVLLVIVLSRPSHALRVIPKEQRD